MALERVGRPNLLAELDLDIQGRAAGVTRFDLAYRTSLFARAWVSDFAGDYRSVVRAAMRRPQAPLAELLRSAR